MQLDHKRVPLVLDEVSEEGTVRGYASVFGNVDQGGDVVLPGAFKESLRARKGRRLPMLWNHDPSQLVGGWTTLEEDERGLRVEGALELAVAKAVELHALARRGVIGGMSIGYRAIKASRDDATGIRRLAEVELWEVSLVTFPMNTEATIEGVKGEALTIERAREMTERDWERMLMGKRDAAPLSRSVAQALMKGGLPALRATRDAGATEAATRMLQGILNGLRS